MRLAKTPADVGTIVLVPFRVTGRKWEEIDETGEPVGALLSPVVPGHDHECLVVTQAELAGFFELARNCPDAVDTPMGLGGGPDMSGRPELEKIKAADKAGKGE